MNRHRQDAVLLFACFVFAAMALASAGHAGLGDAIKKKLGDKATKKTEDAVDKATGDAEKAVPGSKGDDASSGGAKGEGGVGGADDGGKVSKVSTKFDFMPGDSVLFMDDFTQDELGEFPARWKLVEGTFETAEKDGERWLRCTSPDSHIRMKLRPGLPELWTLELDLLPVDDQSLLTVSALDDKGSVVWESTFPHGGHGMAFRSGDIFSTTPLEGAPVMSRHHVMFTGRGSAVKGYMHRERLVNAPDVSERGTPVEFDFRLWSPAKPGMMITDVRFAEGPRPPKDMLAGGKLVTHGIHFATGSDVVMPESAPVLRQVASYMEANPTVRLKITGHTDNVGSAASNLDLSKRRAASVAQALSGELKVAAERFETDGKGDTQAMTSNAKPEGRAMNRRVEFAKL